jgi:predicted helicase
METTFDYLRHFGPLLADRILETYPPLQSTKDSIAPSLTRLLRKALPAQAVAITGTARYLRNAKSARIVAECGAGKTYMALGIGNADAHAAQADRRNLEATISEPSVFHCLLSK